jgi:hypothetical protein
MAAVEGAGRTAVLGVRRRGVPALEGPGRDLILVAAVAIPFAVWNPVVASIVSLAAFGLAHTVLELRWVLARFHSFLSGAFLAALVVPATVIALVRLTGGPKALEIAAGFTLLALAVGQGARTGRLQPPAAALAAAALAIGLVAAVRTPGMYGVVLAHLHNTVTGVLLWEWSSDMAEEHRKRFRTGLAACFAVIPALVLLGLADGLLPNSLGADGPTRMLTKGVTPDAWMGTTAGIRLLAVFTFLQLVHYGVWCWLLPRRAPAPPPDTPIARSWLPAALVATALLALVFATDYATGRTLYTSVATYHAYLEFPVVLVLLGGIRAVR